MLKGRRLCGSVSIEINGAIHNARFCHCGTWRKFSGTAFAAWAPYEPANVPAFRGVPLGVVDEGDVPTPRMHVWTKSKVAWATIDDALPQHETHP